MINWTHRTLIVPSGTVQLARDLCAAIAGPSGADMLITPLSATGQAPATHYISTGLLDEQFAFLLPLTTYADDGSIADVYPGNASMVLTLATAAGLSVTLQDIETMFSQANVTANDPFVAMARLALQLVKTEETV